MVVDHTQCMLLACKTGPTGGVSDLDATRKRSHGPVRSRSVRRQGITDPAASLLDRVTIKGDSFLEKTPDTPS